MAHQTQTHRLLIDLDFGRTNSLTTSDGAGGGLEIGLMHAVHNERVKLTVTYTNNLAVAFLVAGFVAPAASGQLESAGRLIVGIVWIIFATGLHILALAILKGLKE